MPTIRYHGRDIEGRGGHDLLGTILTSGEPIQYLCMSGSCRMCRVRVTAGIDLLEPPGPAEAGRVENGCRLSCQAILRDEDGVIAVEQ